MVNKGLKFVTFLLTFGMLLVTIPLPTFAEDQNLSAIYSETEHSCKTQQESITINTDPAKELLNEESGLLSIPADNSNQFVTNIDAYYPIDQVINRDNIIELDDSFDYVTVTYYFTDGISMNSSAYNSDKNSFNGIIPLSFTVNYDVDKNDIDLYNVYEDSIII